MARHIKREFYMRKDENKEYKDLDDKEDDDKQKKGCSITKKELLEICKDKTPYFEEEKDLFDQKIIPVDAQWGDEEGEYNERWGAYIDEKKGLRVGLKTLIKRLRTDYHFITPIDTKVLHIYANGIYDPSGEEQIRKLLDGKFGTTAQRQVMAELIEHLKDGSFIRREKINAEKGYLPLFNGILNLETLELEAFSPDRLWTFKLPVWYDKKAECPQFEKFLGEVFAGAEDMIPSVQEQFGYCLYPEMPAHVSFWWYGSGANGKTQLANILRALLGSSNVTSIDLRTLENGRFDREHLFGKLANIVGEPDPRKLEKSTVFKACTGEDTIYSDVKYRDQIEFQNFAKMFIYANDYPQIVDVTDAFWRRVLAVNFPNTFKGLKVVKSIGKKIAKAELSGILNWALEGLKRLIANDWEFTRSANEKEAKERMMMMANPVNTFVTERCSIEPSAKTTTEALYKAYKEFCEEKGIGVTSMDRFGKDLSRTPRISGGRVRRSDGRQVRGWFGIRPT
jgi:putative DNA primase/helicase